MIGTKDPYRVIRNDVRSQVNWWFSRCKGMNASGVISLEGNKKLLRVILV